MMEQLERLSKAGWLFTIWLSPHGGVAIQGKAHLDDGDYDFDVQGETFVEAVRSALAETRHTNGCLINNFFSGDHKQCTCHCHKRQRQLPAEPALRSLGGN